MIAYNGGVMVKLSETELKMLVKGGETNTVELNENHVSIRQTLRQKSSRKSSEKKRRWGN